MEDLFRSYWWLLFPLTWFIGSGWTSWLNYRRQRETLDFVRRYAGTLVLPAAIMGGTAVLVLSSLMAARRLAR